jgi:membrane-associated phospholipid phosphatase
VVEVKKIMRTIHWKTITLALLCLLTAPFSSFAQANNDRKEEVPQNTPAATLSPPSNQPEDPSLNGRSSPVTEGGLIKNVWADQKKIWRAPFGRSSYRLSYLLPFATLTAAFLATDGRIGHEVTESPGGDGFQESKNISYLGSTGALIGFPGAYYVFGRLTRSENARRTGLLAFEALADSGIVVEILKEISQRERPAGPNGFRNDNAEGRFWTGGASFPSGHAIGVWTLASVFSESYPGKPKLKYAAYGLAGLISVSRVTARQHFPSDVLVGGALGYLIGHYVIRAHSR